MATAMMEATAAPRGAPTATPAAMMMQTDGGADGNGCTTSGGV